MSAALDWNAWRLVFTTLAVGTTVVVLAGLIAQRWVRPMAWRRTIWQVAFVTMGLLALTEISGGSRALWSWLTPPPQPPAEDRRLAEAKVLGEPDSRMLLVRMQGETRIATSQPAQANVVAPAPIRWPSLIWLLGFGVTMTWMATARLVFAWFVPRRTHRDEGVLAKVRSIAGRLGLSRRVRVAETRGLSGPIAFGILRPGISLPEGFARRYTSEQLDAMLAHELAHLAARDPFWHALADATTAMLWWHPLAWLAKRELRTASESAADEASMVVENGPQVLAECLVELGGRLTRARSAGWLGMADADFRSSLGRRVNRLVSLSGSAWKPVRGYQVWLARIAAPLALLAVVLGTTVWAQPAETTSLQQAFRRSVLGLALATSLPQAPASAVTNSTSASEAELKKSTREGATINQSPQLHTRWFRIDPNTFGRSESATTNMDQAIREAVSAPPALVDSPSPGKVYRNSVAKPSSQEMVNAEARQFFTKAGVDFTVPGKSLVFNERLGQMVVRATLEDLDIIEEAIHRLTASPPQVTIEVKFCEVPTKDMRALGFDWFLGLTGVASNGSWLLGLTNWTSPETSKGFLTDAQWRVVIRALEQRTGVNIMTPPKVTTLSGRQAQVKRVDVRYVVTDYDLSELVSNAVARAAATNEIKPLAEQFELGPVLDVVPYVQADGLTIHLTVIPTITEFLGYDMGGEPQKKTITTADGRTEQVTLPPEPRPIFRKRQIVSSVTAWDGQTVVLAGGSDLLLSNPNKNQPLREGTKPPQPKKETTLLIFVTATLIDPAGNRIHKPEDIPGGIPPQR